MRRLQHIIGLDHQNPTIQKIEHKLKFVNIMEEKCATSHFLDLNAARMAWFLKTLTVTLLDVNMTLFPFQNKTGIGDKTKESWSLLNFKS